MGEFLAVDAVHTMSSPGELHRFFGDYVKCRLKGKKTSGLGTGTTSRKKNVGEEADHDKASATASLSFFILCVAILRCDSATPSSSLKE